ARCRLPERARPPFLAHFVFRDFPSYAPEGTRQMPPGQGYPGSMAELAQQEVFGPFGSDGTFPGGSEAFADKGYAEPQPRRLRGWQQARRKVGRYRPASSRDRPEAL